MSFVSRSNSSAADVKRRIYKESDENEMNIWIMLTGRRNSLNSPNNQRLINFVVTVYKKVCGDFNKNYKNCGTQHEVGQR